MNHPSYPSAAGPGDAAAQPGWYPLRPLQIGEILAAGLRIAVRHLAVLAPVTFLLSALSTAANLLVLASRGNLRAYASGELTRVPVGGSTEQTSEYLHNFYTQVFPALAVSLLVSLVAAPILAGVAAPFAAQAATTRTGTNAAAWSRLRTRLPVLLATGVVVGVAIAIGSVLLIVPGVILWLMLLPAGPVAAMEGLGVSDTVGRAMTLSKGVRLRLLGVSLLIGAIVSVIILVLGSLLDQVVGGDDPVTKLVISQLLAAIVSAVITPWSSTVTAMLYIDIRMRREGLAQALLVAGRPSY